MFFSQVLKKEKDGQIESEDLYKKLQHIVVTILQKELENCSNGRHHILFTAQTKLVELKENATFHRNHINSYTQTGIFHQNAYEKLQQKSRRLEHLIDAYITLHVPEERTAINRRFTMDEETINLIYKEVTHFSRIDSELQPMFLEAIKNDIMPILANIRL